MKEAGKFFLDIAKLVIGGVILTSVMEQELHLFPTITLGLVVVISFFFLGLIFISKSNKERK